MGQGDPARVPSGVSWEVSSECRGACRRAWSTRGTSRRGLEQARFSNVMADGSAGSLVGPARPALVLLAAVRDDLLRLDRPEPVEPLLIQDVPLDQLQRGESVDHAALGLLVGAARLGPPEKGRDRASRVGTGTSLPRRARDPQDERRRPADLVIRSVFGYWPQVDPARRAARGASTGAGRRASRLSLPQILAPGHRPCRRRALVFTHRVARLAR